MISRGGRSAALNESEFEPIPLPITDEALQWLQEQYAARSPQTKPRRPARPTLTKVAEQVAKAGIEVSRYEVGIDGKIVVVVGKPDLISAAENEWDSVQ